MKIQIKIQEDQKVDRLDTIISSLNKACSRSLAVKLINKGLILVNNEKKKPGFKLKPNDIITGIIPDPNCEISVKPENIHLDIQFEDDHLIVINKTAGMVVHPAPGNSSGTLVNALLFHEPSIKGVGQDLHRSGIVHRLDKDTSGLMVVAKTEAALGFLQKEFKQRRVEKRYLALIFGNLPEDHGEINFPIGRHPKKRKMMAVNYKNGKTARTCWKIKKRFKDACLVDVLLKTGRTHQIRVHFYAIDYPLIGDSIYQPRRYRKKKNLAPRQMLHSRYLSFRHPYTGKKMRFEAKLSDDFVKTISILESRP